MTHAQLNDRIRLQIELALDTDCQCTQTRASQERTAQNLGLTGAEIDAARAQRSFDVRTAAAIQMACAIRSGDETGIRAAHETARTVGLTDGELEQVSALVAGRNGSMGILRE